MQWLTDIVKTPSAWLTTTAREDEGTPLEGAELPWQEWLQQKFSHVASKPLAGRHERLWNHIDSLRRGTKPPPYVALWCRGGGKSSSIELGAARLCTTLNRRFLLYLSGTQQQAKDHVQSVASLLEHLGVERKMNPYGYSKGWRQDQLRTANGFNVAGIGVDVAVRGIKFDHFRPDCIFIDDIDKDSHSPEETEKIIQLITRAILPAGSPDCAVIFVQNLVANGSIASRLANRSANFLIGAKVDGPHPAVEGLQYERDPDTVDTETGEVTQGRVRITAGTPTWEGQDLDTCEDQMNEWGPDAFEIEAQHNLSLLDTFFPQYDPSLHLKPAVYTPENPPPHWFKFFGGIDWGFTDPYAWVLCCSDETGRVHVLESYERAKLLNEEQARKITDALDRWSIPIERAVFTYDPSMDNEKTFNGAKAEPDIAAYQRAGLKLRAADPRADSTKHGWGKVREILGKENGIVYYRGYAGRAAEATQEGKPEKNRREELRHDANSHVLHALLYALTGQFGLAKPPESEEAVRKRLYAQKVLKLAEFQPKGGSKVKGRDYV